MFINYEFSARREICPVCSNTYWVDIKCLLCEQNQAFQRSWTRNEKNSYSMS